MSSISEALLRELNELETATLRLASQAAFRRVEDETDQLITVLRPTATQHHKAVANKERLVRWSAAVTSILRRRGSAFVEEVQALSKELGELILLKRADKAKTVEPRWRRSFVDALHMVTLRLEKIVRLEVDSPEAQVPLVYTNLDITLRQLDANRWSVDSSSGDKNANEIVVSSVAFIEAQTRKYVGRENEAAALQDVIDFGALLFETLITGSVRALYQLRRDEAARRAEGLRLNLRLADAGPLAAVPWELLYDGQHFLCLSARTSVTRWIPERVTVVAPARTTIRVLVTSSAPRGMPFLDAAAERQRLVNALAPLASVGRVHVDAAPDGSMNTLRRMLLAADAVGRPYHVWHFIGHGRASTNGGLAMEGNGREPYFAGSFDLNALFGERPHLRLAVLNACEGARSANGMPCLNTATAFVDWGVPSIVAMQLRISDTAAIAFSEEFYGDLADRGSIDGAMAEARRAIYFLPNYSEWFTPVLYQRGDGHLFEHDG